MAATVWTPRRKWLGNLIPTIFWLIPTLIGLWVILHTRVFIGPGLALLGLGTVLGWVILNQFGLFENRKMEAELGQLLRADADLPKLRYFVGFASPKYTGLLDAHEDVGFLCLRPDGLLFVSETRTITLTKGDVSEVRFRSNPHTLVGLGRWVSIEGTAKGQSVRLLVEPRMNRTMLANLRAGKTFMQEVRAHCGV